MSDSKKDPKYDSEDFLEIRIKSQLKLLPANFGSVYDGIKRRLIHDLFKYVPQLGGVLVGWRNLKVLETKVAPVSETDGSCWVPYSARVFVWAPAPGHIIRGCIKNVGSDYVHLNLYGTWLAAIPRQEMPKGVDFSHPLMKEGNWLQFCVQKRFVDDDNRVSIIGTMKHDDAGFISDDEEFVAIRDIISS